MTKYVSLEYVRGFAALTVSISHYLLRSEYSPNYELFTVLAVELFFPLSGFVLAPQIISLMSEKSRLKTFLYRRWMRTLPPYIVAVLCVSVLVEHTSIFNVTSYLGFFKYTLPDYAVGDHYPVAWSLAVEEWYYFLFPIFLLMFARNRCKKAIVVVSVFFVAVFVIVKLVSAPMVPLQFLRVGTFFRLDAIAFGFVFYMLFFGDRTFWIPIVVLIIGAVILPFSLFSNSSTQTVALNAWTLIAIPIFFAALITVLAHLERIEVIRFNSVLRFVGLWLGRLSYSIYLFHLIIIYIFFSDSGSNLLWIYLCVLLCFSTVFYKYFEKPVMNARPKYL